MYGFAVPFFYVTRLGKINDGGGLGLGLQRLFCATNCADYILGHFVIIFQINLQEQTHSKI